MSLPLDALRSPSRTVVLCQIARGGCAHGTSGSATSSEVTTSDTSSTSCVASVENMSGRADADVSKQLQTSQDPIAARVLRGGKG